MKIKVNKNILWCDLFTKRLAELGVKDVCISAGSRSTPLTLSFNMNKSFSVYRFVDERSSAFFALGLAKKSKSPVAIVTTSGTAVAELYPAIIEAFYQRIPLIVCTADRPKFLLGSGANQTINQNNIYKNHIRLFIDAGLPDVTRLQSIYSIANKSFNVCKYENPGPVHINFPFEKPFEPDAFTDIVDESVLKTFDKNETINFKQKESKINFQSLANKLKDKKGLILVGSNGYEKDFPKLLKNFSQQFNFPIYVDGASSLRLGKLLIGNLIDNFTAIVRSKSFQKYFDPEIILQFGSAPTSNVILEFFKNSKAEKILINNFGDYFDPSQTSKKILRINPNKFCSEIILTGIKSESKDWLNNFISMNKIAASFKNKIIERADFPFEGRVITEVVFNLPNKANLFISNSLPIRDFDFFVSNSKKDISLFTNRGASGIDGINSTAFGIAKKSKQPTYLIIGDLAFFHDLNGLYASLKYKIPLTIILINNNGGGIFESLPISKYDEYFKENFVMPLNLDFKNIVKSFGGEFIQIKNWNHFSKELKQTSKSNNLTVLEIKTDAKKSKFIRNDFWQVVSEQIDNYINEIKSQRN